MPQLALSPGNSFFCHPVSGNEEQRQQHYHFPMAESSIFQSLGLDPTLPWLLPLSHPHPYLISHHIWPA